MTAMTLATPRTARHRRILIVTVSAAALVICMALALGFGSVSVPLDRVIAVVARRMHVGDFGVTALEDRIVWQLRLPRVLGAAAAGVALAGCGAVLQSLTRNDLADPYLMGIASGAQVGAVTVIVLGVGVAGVAGGASLTIAGFIGALGTLAIVLALSSGRGGALNPTRVVLAGVVVAYACSAYSAIVILMAGDGDAARRVLAWTLGSMAGVRWGSAVFLVAVGLLAIASFVAFADQLDGFAFGESSARSLGVPVTVVRWTLMVGTALVTAAVVAYVGAIGFVGLVVPHVARLLVGPRHRLLLPVSAVLGAILLVGADTLARGLIDGTEIPVGAVTAVIGAPFFAWLLRRGQNA